MKRILVSGVLFLLLFIFAETISASPRQVVVIEEVTRTLG